MVYWDLNRGNFKLKITDYLRTKAMKEALCRTKKCFFSRSADSSIKTLFAVCCMADLAFSFSRNVKEPVFPCTYANVFIHYPVLIAAVGAL